MNEIVILLIIMCFTSVDAYVTTPVRKHVEGHVPADGNVGILNGTIVSTPKQPLVRRYAAEGQVSADGSIEISAGLVDLPPELSPVRKATEGHVAADSRIGISKGRATEGQGSADASIEVSSPIRKAAEGKVIDDGRVDISSSFVDVTPMQPLVRKATWGHVPTIGSIGIFGSMPKLAFQLAQGLVRNSQELERMGGQAPLLRPNSYNPFSQSFSLPREMVPVGFFFILGTIMSCCVCFPRGDERWQPGGPTNS